MSLRLTAFATLLGAALGQMIKSTVGAGIDISVAIPDVDDGPFDILVKISAPSGTGWASVAWGGEMIGNPLTVAWPNDEGVMVSPRMANGYALPELYDGATVTVLSSSTADDDGWTAAFICTGCSEWKGGSLNPNGENEFAWAFSKRSPSRPSRVDSTFPAHTDKAQFSVDLSKAKLSDKDWSALVETLDIPSGESEAKDEPVEVDDKVEVIVGQPVPVKEPVKETKVEVPAEKTKVEAPIVKTSVILLTPPAATDVDEPTAADENRDGKIPRPTFAPITETEDPKDENTDRIPRPVDEPEDKSDSTDKIPRPVDEPEGTADSTDRIPRPTFLPAPDGSIDVDDPAPTKIPRPTSIPDDPLEDNPDRIPLPRPLPDAPVKSPVPDMPYNPVPVVPPVMPVPIPQQPPMPQPPPVVVAPPSQPWNNPPPPVVVAPPSQPWNNPPPPVVVAPPSQPWNNPPPSTGGGGGGRGGGGGGRGGGGGGGRGGGGGGRGGGRGRGG